jgi:hypothetical protein
LEQRPLRKRNTLAPEHFAAHAQRAFNFSGKNGPAEVDAMSGESFGDAARFKLAATACGVLGELGSAALEPERARGTLLAAISSLCAS